MWPIHVPQSIKIPPVVGLVQQSGSVLDNVTWCAILGAPFDTHSGFPKPQNGPNECVLLKIGLEQGCRVGWTRALLAALG